MKCPNCGIELLGSLKICPKCKFDTTLGMVSPEYLKKLEEQLPEDSPERERLEKIRGQATNFITTTSGIVEGYRISQYLGIRSGHCVLGTGFLSEFTAGFSDMFGVENGRMSSKLAQAKNAAVSQMVAECLRIGADAAIAVDVEIMSIGINMMVASATGTAVKLEKL